MKGKKDSFDYDDYDFIENAFNDDEIDSFDYKHKPNKFTKDDKKKFKNKISIIKISRRKNRN
jgi:plasmid maintenance system killer protein